MNTKNTKELLREELLAEVNAGTIINREQLVDFIRRMKAAGYSKAAAVGTVISFPEAKSFSTEPWADIKELYALASDLYDKV